MLLTIALLTGFVLLGLALTVGLLSLLQVLFRTPAVSFPRVDTRRRAADALVMHADSFLVHNEMLRNVTQSA